MYKDLTGKKFGRWSVISRAGINKFRQVLWRCHCVCGSIKEVPSNSLLGGKSKSCGCLQVEASRGKLSSGSRFHKLKVLTFEGAVNNRSMYRCICDCGNEVVVQMHRLKQGITKSCGCNRKTHGLSNTPEYQRYHANLRRVRKKQAVGSHNLEDVNALFEKQEGKCYYCGTEIPPYHIEHKIPLSRGGSDYRENICLACSPCNLKKRMKTDTEFLELMSYKKI